MLKPERAVQESCISANRVGWVSQYLFFVIVVFFNNTYLPFLVMQHSWRRRVILTIIPTTPFPCCNITLWPKTDSVIRFSLEEPQKNTEVSERRALPVYVTSEGYLLLVYYALWVFGNIHYHPRNPRKDTPYIKGSLLSQSLSLSFFF